MVYAHDFCCATASARVRARLALLSRGASTGLRTVVDARSRRRTERGASSGPQCWGSLRTLDGQPPNAAGFVCGAMAVPRRFACVRRGANGSSGAASQREHNEMVPRSLPTIIHTRALGRSTEASGAIANGSMPFRFSFGAWQRRSRRPTNWQLCSAAGRIYGRAAARRTSDRPHRTPVAQSSRTGVPESHQGLPLDRAKPWEPSAARSRPRASPGKK